MLRYEQIIKDKLENDNIKLLGIENELNKKEIKKYLKQLYLKID